MRRFSHRASQARCLMRTCSGPSRCIVPLYAQSRSMEKVHQSRQALPSPDADVQIAPVKRLWVAKATGRRDDVSDVCHSSSYHIWAVQFYMRGHAVRHLMGVSRLEQSAQCYWAGVPDVPELASQLVLKLDSIQNMRHEVGTVDEDRSAIGRTYGIRWPSVSFGSQIGQKAVRHSKSLGRQACRWPAEGGLCPRLCASCRTSSASEVSGRETAVQIYPRQYRQHSRLQIYPIKFNASNPLTRS
jgi:hypothetical protein